MTDTSVVFINVLEVEPGRQRELVALLLEGAETVVRHRPGYVSGTIYASLDGTRVVNCASWRAPEDAAATRADPAAAAYARRAAAMATAGPAVYRVAATIE
ncbi:antibiotic biosynthesis monooxygenase [Glycomyces sp. A-F 0318]|uniref:antibiotic biosynthesis monooxygenase n=1 Tax=Glycomyces amatae TaxID=2881355 RepID=UPI001E3780B1|nr:antibiotic biosynthesis monooxygenase [Glycomyces amatae]MCD0446213.1 antibiotic biosynthesis monooxygenase [Glycomyces amatae]